jgi:3-oxoadipate enol-lactonase
MAYGRTRLGRWFYEEHGVAKHANDPVILLCHGLLFDMGMWEGQMGPLGALGRVVALDGPGHGRSESPPRFTLEDHADAMLDVFAELGIRRVVVVGLSWGGMVGMRLALQHPERVAGLALIDTSADPEPLASRVKYRAFIAIVRRVGAPPFFMQGEIAPLCFARQTLAERPELVRDLTRNMNTYPRDGMARAALAVVVHRTSIRAKLGAIAAPTLVLCGREDRATPPHRSEAIAAGIPGAKLVMLDGCGHMSAMEQPARVNELLVPFVKNAIATAPHAPSPFGRGLG